MYVFVSKALLISSATVVVRVGGAIWLNPFATVLFSVCSAVTVECCVKTPIYTGTETDTHAHCIPGRVAGRNDLSYIVNSGKTHCK